MQSQLSILEGKLGQLIQLTQRLREENLQLRQDLAIALSQGRKSEDKIAGACSRLEHLLANLPEDLTHDDRQQG
jgi:cell division protein ZapB